MWSEPSVSSEAGAGLPRDLPRVIGGYRVTGEPGRSRIGPVVRARHVPTGRAVDLSILKTEWACLPAFVARLTRDACAVTPVEHPNLVRLYEVGEAQGRFFFATQRIDGPTLAERVSSQGPLAAREAVTHLLQAARGLRFAHAQGLSHGAVGADCLVVSDDGHTKVSGLGLSATPESVAAEAAKEATGPIPLGAEPENQALIPAVRADIRGLGATLVHLLTGRPFTPDAGGSDAGSLVARGVPANMVELVRRLLDAQPGTGITDCGQLIAVLEQILTAKKPGALAPSEEDSRVLATCADTFRASPSARMRSQLILGGVAVCGLVILLSLLIHQPRLAFSFLGLGLMTGLARFILRGWHGESDVFPDVRALVLECRASDWLIAGAGVLLLVASLLVLHLLRAWLGFAAMAVTMAVGLRLLVDSKVDSERHDALEQARTLVKNLRTQGVSEEAIRGLVRGASGSDWEEFFESLFGYEAKLAARRPSERGLKGLLYRKHGAWRDWVMPWVEAVRAARRSERETALFQSIEVRALVASGINLLTARRKSKRIAEAMVAVATEARAAARRPHVEAFTPAGEPLMAAAIRKAAETPEEVLAEREHGLIGTRTWWVVDVLTGARLRFLLGAALVAGFLVWAHQNKIYSTDQIKDAATKAFENPETLRDARIDVHLPAGATTPLQTSFLPGPIARLFHDFNPGVAGLILIVSAFFRGSRVGYFAIPGAAIALFGPSLGLPRIGPLDPERASMAVGAGVAALALFFGRGRDG
jgi:eukaryotic-like serine/threonine-protein kinase